MEACVKLRKKWLQRRKGVGTIIGAAFFLLIFTSVVSFLYMYMIQTHSINDAYAKRGEMDLRKIREELEFVSVDRTIGDKLNITVINTGPLTSRITYIGEVNQTSNPEQQEFHQSNTVLSPGETQINIANDTIGISDGETKKILLFTKLGNIFTYIYPEASVGDSLHGRYYWVDETCDLRPPSGKGNHSFFSAQQGYPDSILDTLTEENTVGSSISNQTAGSDLDRKDWITSQNSAGDVSAGVLSDTYSSNDARYELVETIATGGPPPNRNYLLAWRFDFTSLPSSRKDTHIHIEAQTTGENFRVYWSSDDATMNYLGTITSTSDSWVDWDVPDDVSTTIYILIKDINDEMADGTDTSTADSIKIDTLFLETTSSEINYELDLEVLWTDVDYDEANEYLSIYGGTMGSEDILVDVWNGTSWENILTDLSSGWNNVDVSSYLDSNTFNIRFRGGVETGDATTDSWEIDATFLHVWT